MDDFVKLVENESRGLVAAVTAIIGDRHRAEEIVQDAFERCFRRWGRVSRLDRPGAWVRRVAINEAISVTRRSASEHRAVQRVGAMNSVGDGGSADPLAALDFEGVWAAVRALPQDQSAAISLRYAADLSVEETAEAMKTTVPAVKSLLYRGRTSLRATPAIQSYTD